MKKVAKKTTQKENNNIELNNKIIDLQHDLFHKEQELADLARNFYQKKQEILEMGRTIDKQKEMLFFVRNSKFWKLRDRIERIKAFNFNFVKKLIKKVFQTLKNDGLVNFGHYLYLYLKHGSGYFENKYQLILKLNQEDIEKHFTIVKKKKIDPKKYSILFTYVHGNDFAPYLYRVKQKVEQLKIVNPKIKIKEVSFDDLPKLRRLVPKYDIIFYFRVPVNDSMMEVVQTARRSGAINVYDIDDLIFDEKIIKKEFAFFKTASKKEKEAFLHLASCHRKLIKECDSAMTTTKVLEKEMEKLIKPVFIHRNALSMEIIKFSCLCRERFTPIKKDNLIKVGYLSGSNTHNKDFQEIAEALLKLFKKYPHWELHVVGFLKVDKRFDEFKNRIKKHGFVHWKQLPFLINDLDINIAPLENNIFCAAKSELKYFGAALLKIPTIASRVGAFKHAIKDGENGFLADNTDEWEEKLGKLITNKDYRLKIGDKAYKASLEEYSPYPMGGKLNNLFKQIINRHDQKTRKNVVIVKGDFNIYNLLYPNKVNKLFKENILKKAKKNNLFIFTSLKDKKQKGIYILWEGLPVYCVDAKQKQEKEVVDIFKVFLELVKADEVYFHNFQNLREDLIDVGEEMGVKVVRHNHANS